MDKREAVHAGQIACTDVFGFHRVVSASHYGAAHHGRDIYDQGSEHHKRVTRLGDAHRNAGWYSAERLITTEPSVSFHDPNCLDQCASLASSNLRCRVARSTTGRKPSGGKRLVHRIRECTRHESVAGARQQRQPSGQRQQLPHRSQREPHDDNEKQLDHARIHRRRRRCGARHSGHQPDAHQWLWARLRTGSRLGRIVRRRSRGRPRWRRKRWSK